MLLTVGYSPCPNDTFLFHALVHGLVGDPKVRWEPHLHDVETLNEMALHGKLPVTKLSFHGYAHCWERYQLLRAGSALGFGCGPLLITRPGLEATPPEAMRIAVPGRLTTAHFLLMLAYPDAKDKHFMVFSDIERAVLDGRVDAGVIIHENRFTYAEKGLALIRDLGAWWESHTGAPIPLGGIAVRRDLDEDLKRSIGRDLAASVRYAWSQPTASADYVACHAQEMDTEVMHQHIALYVNTFTEDIGTLGQAAVERMYQEAFSKGLLSSLPQDIFTD